MNTAVIRALLARDLGMIRRSRALMLPMLFLPTLLLVVLPAAIGLAARERTLDVETFVNMLPAGIADPILEAPPDERLILLVLGYMVAPLFLIVPLLSAVITPIGHVLRGLPVVPSDHAWSSGAISQAEYDAIKQKALASA